MFRFLRKKPRISEIYMTSSDEVEIVRKYEGMSTTRSYKVTDGIRWSKIWKLCSKKFPDKSFSGKYFCPPWKNGRDWYVHFWTNSATVIGKIFIVIWGINLIIYSVWDVVWEVIWKLFW